MGEIELVPHLFKNEYSKLVSVLAKSFGIQHIEIAEDIASETFLSALETWPYKGIPANPTAWLYTVAKNKTKNHFSRGNLFNQKIIDSISSKESLEEKLKLAIKEERYEDAAKIRDEIKKFNKEN